MVGGSLNPTCVSGVAKTYPQDTAPFLAAHNVRLCAAAAEWITKRGERNSDSNLSNGPVAVWPPEHCYWLATLAVPPEHCHWLATLAGLHNVRLCTTMASEATILVMDRSQCGHHNTATVWQHWLVCTQCATVCGCVLQWPLRRLNGLQSAEKETATVILVMDRSQCGHQNTTSSWEHWLV
ncbi:hypothetical protein J6590_025003 [Homalodisca vitripennis]|nr:hypothetical protein J6590_025003 [Homalodisca vitripennis]